MEWTPDQEKVIDTRGSNILVSAAAGSGKTAVLVERVLKHVVEQGHDIDEYLVVTFTRAAAAQMKKKIRAALETYQQEHPGDEHVIRQISLVHKANITTIDSFCKSVVDEYFSVIGLDPSTGILDDTEARLLKEDVMSNVVELCHETYPEEMRTLLKHFGCRNDDAKIREEVGRIAMRADSFPDPKAWLGEALRDAEQTSKEALEKTAWMQELVTHGLEALAGYEDLPGKMRELHEAYKEGKVSAKVMQHLDWMEAQVDRVAELSSYEDIYAWLHAQSEAYPKGFQWRWLVNDSIPGSDEVKAVFTRFNDTVKLLRDGAFLYDMEELVRQQEMTMPVLRMLITMTELYMDAFHGEKVRRKRMDFADVEHYALQVLTEVKDGVRVPTSVALGMRDHYEEILIDEYQDSNDLQEAILMSVAKRDDTGRCMNLFMVGDLKQSIYRFRMARPQLFVEKYDAYTPELLPNTDPKRIELRMNFRSRGEVLDGANGVCAALMRRELGGVDYDEGVKLEQGRPIEAFPPEYEGTETKTELLFLDLNSEPEQEPNEISGNIEDLMRPEGEEGEEMPKGLEAEVIMIANRIKELVDPEHPYPIWDEEKEAYRPCTYRDIVILCRSLRSTASTFADILSDSEIPVYLEAQSGYFDSVEIVNILNILSVIDNTRNSPALAGVLKGPTVGLTDGDLALLRIGRKKEELWDSVQVYLKRKDADPGIKEKLEVFIARLKVWKVMKTGISIRELIRQVLKETGYLDYVSAMPSGARRRENVLLLLDKAGAFERTSYHGLFDFLRYIDRMKILEQDEASAQVLGEQDDLVRIMTIHKSKGLEFPVVFVSACGKQFFTGDEKKACLVDPDRYLSVHVVDAEKHYRVKSGKHMVLASHEHREMLSEEMRIFYVAMTRAKEKLILTGVRPKPTKDGIAKAPTKAASYADWLETYLAMSEGAPEEMQVRIMYPADLVQPPHEEEKMYQQRLDRWERRVGYEVPEEMEPMREEIEKRFSYLYPHMEAVWRKGKLSVTEIKKMSQAEEENLLTEDWKEAEDALKKADPFTGPAKPAKKRAFRGKGAKSGADYGTLMHKVMEKIDFVCPASLEETEATLTSLKEQHILNDEEAALVSADRVYTMLSSELGRRMCAAYAQGKLHREAPFIISLNFKDIYPDTEEADEIVLTQGIIDAYFEEEDGLVLMDYKTDTVTDDGTSLVQRYRVQLEQYKSTLERLTHKKVKETYLYSFALGKQLKMD